MSPGCFPSLESHVAHLPTSPQANSISHFPPTWPSSVPCSTLIMGRFLSCLNDCVLPEDKNHVHFAIPMLGPEFLCLSQSQASLERTEKDSSGPWPLAYWPIQTGDVILSPTALKQNWERKSLLDKHQGQVLEGGPQRRRWLLAGGQGFLPFCSLMHPQYIKHLGTQ